VSSAFDHLSSGGGSIKNNDVINTQGNVNSAVIMIVTAIVLSDRPIKGEQQRATDNHQNKITDVGCEPACMLLSSTPTTYTYNHFNSH